MAFPTRDSLAKVWTDTQVIAANIKSQANAALVDLDFNVSAAYVLGIYQRLISAQSKLAENAATPGLADYVKDQLDDQGINIVTEYNALIAAIESVKTEIVSTFPSDGSGYLLEKKFSSTGFSQRTFAPASTANLKAALQTLISVIE